MANFEELKAWFKNFGITFETVRKCGVQYAANKRWIVYPLDGGDYAVQPLDVVEDRSRIPKGKTRGVFNLSTIYRENVSCVFVVDSPIDCLAIEQVGGSAVGLCGTGGAGKLLELLEKKPTSALFVVCDYSHYLPVKRAELQRLVASLGEDRAMLRNLCGGYARIYERLLHDSDGLKVELARGTRKTKEVVVMGNNEKVLQISDSWGIAEGSRYSELPYDELLDKLLYESKCGCRYIDWLLDKALSGSLAVIEQYKKEIEASRKAVGELLMELEARHCHELGFISEYWNGFFECRKDNDVFYLDERIEQVTDYYPEVWWVLIKDFVLRLNEAKLLGDLADIDTIKLRLKPDWNDWTVEELEKTVAKVKSWEQQKRKAVSC